MQHVNIDTDDIVNICCFSMRQKSQSQAFSRFSRMVSSFHMGGKMASFHVDNESADAIERLSKTSIGDALWFARSKRPEVQADF